MKIEAEKLLPCPFCGADAQLTEQGSRVVRVTCSNWESCDMFPQIKGSRTGAIAAWNRRATNPGEV